ncbi:unnamed protein product [Didymodactylos carnosus]|uniref:Peptidase C51 domain-containing protein n=1 Tax=Didymodactylos carnosus TaxID=1234261 RepID=A0A8S2IN09_9BILA|nr:unnamed protein product [Didymodactylos carnosus]CAF3758492.1 unnamed protein product [Didymodactylos carnosus]
MIQSEEEFVPFNQIQGIAATNVPAYSNGDDDFFSVERHYFHGIFMGFKWQCVEFARRWLLLRKSCIFKNIGCAADIWTGLTHVERVTDGQHFQLKAHANGSSQPPQKDSFLIYPRNPEQPFGHIAIICEVVPGFVCIAEQNHKFHYWSENYARQIPVVFKNGGYYIEDEDEVFGWIEIENGNQLQPLDESKMDIILKHYQRLQPIGKMQRRCISSTTITLGRSWLNMDDPAEKLFIEMFGEDIVRVNTSPENVPYYQIDHDLLLSIGSTSNELHRLFMTATEHVIHNDDLLRRFGIPDIFWTRIRHSWKNDQGSTMTGRFDLAFDGKQLKVFEYNADSASALFECAVIQDKWAKAVNLPSTFMSGFQLHRVLVKNWKHLNIKTRVHILIDTDKEELLTAFYMQNVMKEAGIDSKLCIMTDDLYWQDSTIVDNDGVLVKVVWKLWMWETVFRDYTEAQTERCNKNEDQWKPVNGEHPRLSDILLNDHVRVIEPLWKVITSNKALLSVVWSMFPNHPNLLHTEWTLTNDLKQAPFVKKPIVGRCGQNVTLYQTNGDSVIDESTGKFSNRDCIYQELFPLTNYDGYYGIICSWIISGLFAGFCVREDKKLITDGDSPVTACCIVWTKEEN